VMTRPSKHPTSSRQSPLAPLTASREEACSQQPTQNEIWDYLLGAIDREWSPSYDPEWLASLIQWHLSAFRKVGVSVNYLCRNAPEHVDPAYLTKLAHPDAYPGKFPPGREYTRRIADALRLDRKDRLAFFIAAGYWPTVAEMRLRAIRDLC
jgi:hypothetical protein